MSAHRFLALVVVLCILFIPVSASHITKVIYPDPNDGYVYTVLVNDFTVIRDTSGSTVANNNTAAPIAPGFTSYVPASKFNYLSRLVAPFYTNGKIPTYAANFSANFSVQSAAITNPLNVTLNITLTGGVLGSNATLVAGDYDNFLQQPLAAAIPQASWVVDTATPGNRNYFPLTNASYVDRFGYTVLYMRTGNDYFNGFDGIWAPNQSTGVQTYTREGGIDTRGPRLVLDWDFNESVAPANVSGLTHRPVDVCGIVNWSWSNPTTNWSYTNVYKNNVLQYNSTNATENWTGMPTGTPYTISTQTCDSYGQCNSTWVNQTIPNDCYFKYWGYGDSVMHAAGYGDLDEATSCFVLQMRSAHDPTATAYHNLDGGGMTSTWGKTNLESHWPAGGMTYSIMEFGLNDISSGIPEGTTGQNLVDMCDYAEGNGSTCYVGLVAGTTSAWRDRVTFLEGYLAGNNTKYVKLYDSVDDIIGDGIPENLNATYQASGVHPNNAGHWNMGESFWYYGITYSESFTQQDIEMDPLYTLTIHFTDSTTNTAIPTVTVTTSSGQTNTSINGVVTFFEPYSTVVVYASATGYVSTSHSYVMDSDRDEVIQMVPAIATPALNTWYSQKLVKITVVNTNGVPLIGANTSMNFLASSLPNTDISWIQSAFGVTALVAEQMQNSTLTMTTNTGDDGAASFMVFPGFRYGVTIVNTTTGLNHYTTIHPSDSDYIIYCPTVNQNAGNQTQLQLVNTTLFITEPNMSYVTFNFQYQDTSSLTTSVTWNVTNTDNMTPMYYRTFASPGTSALLDNYTVPNVRGQQWKFFYNATRSAKS